MYDHLLMFKDEDEAVNALSNYDFSEVSVIGNQQIIVVKGTEEAPPICIPGYFMTIAKDTVDKDLIALPNEACRIVSDREAAERQENFFIYVAPSLDLQLLSTITVSPVFAGSEYPFCAS